MNYQAIIHELLETATRRGYKLSFGVWKGKGHYFAGDNPKDDQPLSENNPETYATVLSHSFNKAFFGDGVNPFPNSATGKRVYRFNKAGGGQMYSSDPAWQYHLKEAIMHVNPLDYYAKFISGDIVELKEVKQ